MTGQGWPESSRLLAELMEVASKLIVAARPRFNLFPGEGVVSRESRPE